MWTSVCHLVFMRWAISCCLDIMSFIIRVFREQGATALHYIDDFGAVPMDKQMATQHFSMLHRLLEHLGLDETLHKASAPAHAMTRLGLHFNTVDMTVSIPQEKMQDRLLLVEEWSPKRFSQHALAMGPPQKTVPYSAELLVGQAVLKHNAHYRQRVSRNRQHRPQLKIPEIPPMV